MKKNPAASSQVEISDHAIVRFLERNGLINIEGLRRQIAAPLEDAVQTAQGIGATRYNVKKDQWRYIFKGRKLIELPEPYLVWFKQEGFPHGVLGRRMAVMYEIKLNGLEKMLQPLVERDRDDED